MLSPRRYSEEPAGLLALDPQLLCYSWMTGIPEVAMVVFVRKRLPEIQYLRTTLSNDQRDEYGRLVEDTIRQIEAARFLPHSGIRFPNNGCVTCPFVGICLCNQDLVSSKLVQVRGGERDLNWGQNDRATNVTGKVTGKKFWLRQTCSATAVSLAGISRLRLLGAQNNRELIVANSFSNLINREKNRERKLAKGKNLRKWPCFANFQQFHQKITGKDQGGNREDRGKNRE
jgi:hypothetical protein